MKQTDSLSHYSIKAASKSQHSPMRRWHLINNVQDHTMRAVPETRWPATAHQILMVNSLRRNVTCDSRFSNPQMRVGIQPAASSWNTNRLRLNVTGSNASSVEDSVKEGFFKRCLERECWHTIFASRLILSIRGTVPGTFGIISSQGYTRWGW